MIFLLIIAIYLAKKTQINLLITKKIIILEEYFDFLNIFLEKKTLVLLEITNFNQYTIKLQQGHQLAYELIYSLQLIEFKILKIYIKTTQPITLFSFSNHLLRLLSFFFVSQIIASNYVQMIRIIMISQSRFNIYYLSLVNYQTIQVKPNNSPSQIKLILII